jgi:sec-independent protein translocase protein TatC
VFIVGAIITPPDVMSQLLLAIPLWLLFEGSLLIMRFSEKKAAAETAAAEAEEAEEAVDTASEVVSE